MVDFSNLPHKCISATLLPYLANNSLEDFNYEQQADIIEDAFRLANGYTPQWVLGRGAEVLPVYYPYLTEIRERKLPSSFNQTI